MYYLSEKGDMEGSSVDPVQGGAQAKIPSSKEMALTGVTNAKFRWAKIFDTNNTDVKFYPSYKTQDAIILKWVPTQYAYFSSEKVIPCGDHSGEIVINGKVYPLEVFQVRNFNFEIDLFINEDCIEDTVDSSENQEVKTIEINETTNIEEGKMNDPSQQYTSKYKDHNRNKAAEKESFQIDDGITKTNYMTTSETTELPSDFVKERKVTEKNIYTTYSNNQPPASLQQPLQPPKQRNLFKLLYGNQVGNYDTYNLDDRESQKHEPTVVKRSSPAGEAPLELVNKDLNIEISGSGAKPLEKPQYEEPTSDKAKSSNSKLGEINYPETHTTKETSERTYTPYRSPYISQRTTVIDNRLSDEERKKYEDTIATLKKLLGSREDEISDLHRQLSSLRDINRSLRDEVDRYKNHVCPPSTNTLITAEYERRFVQLQNEKDIMASKVSRLNDEIHYLRKKSERNTEDNTNTNDLLKRIAELESANRNLTEANDITTSELNRKNKRISELVGDKGHYRSHESSLLHDDRYCPYKYKVYSNSLYTKTPVDDTYKSRYAEKHHQNGYSRDVEETVNNAPNEYTRNRTEVIQDETDGDDRNKRSYKSQSRSSYSQRVNDMADNNVGRFSKSTDMLHSTDLDENLFPELTKYSTFNAGVTGKSESPQKQYHVDSGDISDTPTDILLGTNPMDRCFSHSSPFRAKKTTNYGSDSSLSEDDEGYHTIYRKRSKSVLGRGRYDDAVYLTETQPVETEHCHITTIRPSASMEGLAPHNHRLEPSLTGCGYRSVLPKPLITQQNKHLYTSSQSTIDFSNSITHGMRPYSPSSPADIKTNDIVKFSRQGGKLSIGFVRFIGQLPGRSGIYLGVELYKEEGKHDGVFDEVRYFKCKPNKGVFVAYNKVVMAWTTF
ncbi:hypothetical protein SNE40_020115 [Patella caerulea]|uniref:CAP-Gly domain-containing protein n=1 Tax=Patella caerulea TaxID=87958 RepID=A0AAN8G6X5_PATCE